MTSHTKRGAQRGRTGLAGLLAVLMVSPPYAAAQQAPLQPAAPPQALKVVVLAGENEMNDLGNGVMAPLVVQVLDQNDQPVEGAEVIFRFPLDGPSARFANDQTAQTTRSNATGQARAAGWTANNQVGAFRVQVTALRGGEQGQASVAMNNVTRIADVEPVRQRRWWTSKWAIVAYIAGAAALGTGIVLATRSNPPTITATPGTPTIGGPQ
jgi:hypothetical protein